MKNFPVWQRANQKRVWFDLLWVVLFLILLVATFRELQSGRLCHQMGVDFRGYYASAQIALEHGFAEVYNQDLQKDFQSALLCRCPTPAAEPPIFVAMPYLPVFVVFLLPFVLIDFTASYYIWLMLQLVVFFFYLVRFTKALGVNVSVFRVLQWGVCIPLISNLYLGQINAFLVVLLGEFLLAFSQGKEHRSGLWLSTLLIKPHVLILLIPGFILSQNWPLLLGFALGSMVVVAVSVGLAGFQGLAAMLNITFRFAGSFIQTAPGMMNFRALALNLETFIPAWISWLIAVLGMIAIFVLVLRLWLHPRINTPSEKILLIAATVLGTFVISWHSHFYMLILLSPLLLYLDLEGLLAPKLRAAWLLAPPLIYLSAHWVAPTLERPLFGLGMLALNITLLLGILRQIAHPKTM